MAPYLIARSDSVDAYSVPPVSPTMYIVGFTLAGLLVAAVMLWFFRRKLQAKCAEERGAAFLNVRGVIREMDEPVNHFLSGQPTPSVVFPQKAIVPRTSHIASPSRHDHVSSSQIHATCAVPPPRPRALSNLNPAHPHHSRASSASSVYSRSAPRLPPGLHSRESSRSSSSSQARPVRQLFQPVLPDELPLSRVGDYLHVLQSFDDGWCLVAQNNIRRSRSSLSIFNPSRLSARVESGGENAQLGLVPAWVFIKPMKGLRVERPVRSTSAGLQVGLDTAESRDSVISWSNFA
ncbi:hypothetical protein DFH29DRAFT_972515 [Suillus ampliporus]|nr:hypothetical protein DFH29DRAFT_972515 [Suillus ampliporus]